MQFMEYGPGIYSYFQVLEALMANFFCFSIIMLLPMILYYTYGGQYSAGGGFYENIQ